MHTYSLDMKLDIHKNIDLDSHKNIYKDLDTDAMQISKYMHKP